jgi:hypothetical protein
MTTMTLHGAAILFAVVIFANAQEPSTSPANRTAPTQAQAPAADREQVEGTLKKYESAYQHMSLYELQNIWPDLLNQKKEYRKAEEMFRRGDVSGLQVSVQIQDMRWLNDSALVQCIRHEQYTMTSHSTLVVPNRSGPTFGTVDQRDTRKVKNDREVEFTLRRSGGNWIIASLSETGKSKHAGH